MSACQIALIIVRFVVNLNNNMKGFRKITEKHRIN